MKRKGVLTGLAVLVIVAATLGLSRFGQLQGGSTTTPPPASCRAAEGDQDRIVVREQPSLNSNVIARVTSADSPVIRIDARTVKGRGDWIQVRHDGGTGWAVGAEVICRLPPEAAQQVIAQEAAQVMAALDARNMTDLAAHVHPIKGVRLSPSVDVDPKRSVVLSSAEVAKALDDPRRRVWGSEDGSGDPISRSFADYYTRFIYDRNFAGESQQRFNEFGTKSTTRSNIWELYPNAIVVEYHVPGTKPESEGMDWASLLLVFEQHESRWYLSALVHDQWTI